MLAARSMQNIVKGRSDRFCHICWSSSANNISNPRSNGNWCSLECHFMLNKPWFLIQIYRISSYSFHPWIVSSLEYYLLNIYALQPLALVGNVTFGFPNPKENTFRGNYLRTYGIYICRMPWQNKEEVDLVINFSCRLYEFHHSSGRKQKNVEQ